VNVIVPDRVGVAEVSVDQTPKTPPRAAVPHGARLRPLHDRVLVRRFAEETVVGGIIIPSVAREKSLMGEVVAVGPGKKDADGVFRETMVKPGDVVVFSGSVNVPYPDLIEDGELVMMAEADILGVVEEAASF
jgi:chaperonin GroES